MLLCTGLTVEVHCPLRLIKCCESQSDIDECALGEDACKGGMQCINHFGGYLCLPRSAVIYISQDGEQLDPPPDAPDVPAVPAAVPAVPSTTGALGIQLNQQPQAYPSNPRVSRPGRCAAGFTADEQNFCRGRVTHIFLKTFKGKPKSLGVGVWLKSKEINIMSKVKSGITSADKRELLVQI